MAMEGFSFRKKKIILKFTPLSIVLEALGLAALIAVLLVADRFYPGLAGTVPTRFAADGSVLETGLRETTLLRPILAVFVYIIVTCVNIIIRQSCPPGRPLPALHAVLNGVAAAKALFLAYEALLTWYAMHLRPAPGWPLWALLAAVAAAAAVTALFIRKRRPERGPVRDAGAA